MIGEPRVLRPFHRSEAIPVVEAAHRSGCSVRTMRERCLRYDLGRRIGGQWAVSKVALAMWLDGAKEALAAYLAGDRTSPLVFRYFERCEVPLPRLVSGDIPTTTVVPRTLVIGSKLRLDGPNV